MYIPRHFAWNDSAAIDAFMAQHSFATLIAVGATSLEAQHLPLLIERQGEQLTLSGHVARSNPLWQATEALAVFHGPHAYISPTWYDEANAVPTWNYQAVHARGRLTAITDAMDIQRLFERLGAIHDGAAASAWWQRLDQQTYQGLAQAIVWFRITVTDLQAKAKLSQNHSAERRRRVIAKLRERGSENDRAVAAAMDGGG